MRRRRNAEPIDAVQHFIDRVARISRVCTYDRAGTGVSDERPMGLHVTAGLMAEERSIACSDRWAWEG